MSFVPPGIAHLAYGLPQFFLNAAITSAGLHVLSREAALEIPIWLYIVAGITSNVLLIVTRYVYAEYRAKQNSKAFGAVLAPQVQESSTQMLKKLGDPKGYLGEAFQQWSEEYGHTYRFNMFGDSRMFTTEPEHIKALLATQFNDFGKGPTAYDINYDMLGSGVFNSDSDMWKFHRSMTRPFFNKDRISDFDTFDAHAEDVISQMKARLAEGQPVDFQDAVARFTLDSATEYLFGTSVGSMNAGLPYPERSPLANNDKFLSHASNKFVHAFVTGQEHLVRRSRMGSTWRLGKTEFWKNQVQQLRRDMDEFVTPIVKAAIARKRSGEKLEKGEDGTFLDNLVQNTEDEKILTDELVNILVAGRDTTSSTTAFAVYMLTQRPDIVTRLRDELLQKVGPTRRPTYDDIRDMKYLRAFVNEILRLYPVVPFNSRTSIKATTLPNKTGDKPWFVPARTRVTYSVFLMHRRTDLWGPDAETFDPDRFLDERLGKYLTHNPFIFLPFNAGPRICLGQQFAYNEMSFFLIRLLQNFSSFELAPEAQPESSKPPAEWVGQPGRKGVDKVKFYSTLTMMIEGGLWTRMTPA